MTAPKDTNPTVLAQQWLAEFAAALYAGNAKAVVDLMQPDGLLRDGLTFSWDNRTLQGSEKIIEYLLNKLPATKITNVTLSKNNYLLPKFAPSFVGAPGAEFGYSYETPIARGEGYVRLVKRDDNEWKAHTISMLVMDLKGHEEPNGRHYFEDLTRGKSWGVYLAEQRAQWEKDPHVIVGECD